MITKMWGCSFSLFRCLNLFMNYFKRSGSFLQPNAFHLSSCELIGDRDPVGIIRMIFISNVMYSNLTASEAWVIERS